MPQVLLIRKDLRQFVGGFFERFGLKLVIKPQEDKLEVQREAGGVVLSHPYCLVSDTLRRLIFHIVAMETNQDSILIFEEPEAHAFPLYTKYLAERIARDHSNQYFLSTHDPFFLISLVEKTPSEDMAVFVVYLQDSQTTLQPLTGKALEEVLDLDAEVFFNLDLFLENPERPQGVTGCEKVSRSSGLRGMQTG